MSSEFSPFSVLENLERIERSRVLRIPWEYFLGPTLLCNFVDVKRSRGRNLEFHEFKDEIWL